MTQDSELQKRIEEAHALVSAQQTVQLATCSSAGQPEASYAPYVELEGRYFIYVSELARHCANLAATGRCAALFIESEADAKTPFARRRLTLHCTAQEVERNDALFEQVMDQFQARFGKFMDAIRPLLDFHLYQLTPVQGSLVTGFAKAYTLGGENLSDIRWRNETGHRSPDAQARAKLDALAV